jgi:GrpB-like predicted nucleotidyltransferase (UPF0157 family)
MSTYNIDEAKRQLSKSIDAVQHGETVMSAVMGGLVWRVELRRHLAFRDALRADPALRDDYAALKRSLAKRHSRDRVTYTAGKSACHGRSSSHTIP